MTLFKTALTFLAAACCHFGAAADPSYPNKPVTVVVPFPAGGGVDMIARAISSKLSEKWKQPVVIENKGGASGLIAAQHVVQSRADGYTLLFTAEPILAINPLVFSKLPYKVEDFALISAAVSLPQALFVTSKNKDIQTLPELIAYAKQHPGKLTYGSFGTASSPQLAMEQFKTLAGIDILHVPYRGASPAITDLSSGTVDMIITGVQSAKPALDSGNARVIAMAGTTRAPKYPDVKTFAEMGFPALEATAYLGMVAPAQTPRAVIDKIAADIRDIVRNKEFQNQYILPANQVPMGTTPKEYEKLMSDLRTTLAPIIKKAGITAD